MISLGDKVTDTAYVPGLLEFFCLFYNGKYSKFLLHVNEDKVFFYYPVVLL